ncbi:hypothetical protein SK128_019235 [Halocaridina rubra]|uniref:Uncharacterized protein n=1 Tax=Halocaridina rubra TaxID=373956 RepID=A0AAN8WVD3_HALRR
MKDEMRFSCIFSNRKFSTGDLQARARHYNNRATEFTAFIQVLWDAFVEPATWDASEGASLHEVRTGADLVQEVSMALQEAALSFLEVSEDGPETKLLPLSNLFSP